MKARSLSASEEASSESLGNAYLDALLWLTPVNPFGGANATTISFSFGSAGDYTLYDPESTVDFLRGTNWNALVGPKTAVSLPNGDVISFPNGVTTGEQAATYVALITWANVANFTLHYTSQLNNADFKFLVTDEIGMRNFWSGEKGVLGFAELPNNYGPNYGIDDPNYSSGYAVFNQNGYGWTTKGLAPGGYGFVTILHEIGHLFGLDHPWNEGGYYINEDGSRGAPEPFFPGATTSNKTGENALNQGIFTTMSYNDGWNKQPSKSTDWGYQIGPGAFDIAAIQELYGANMNYHVGNDTYTLPGINASGTGWFAIWDAGGTDTIAVPNGAGTATIDLRAATLLPGDPGAGGYVSWVKGIAGGFTIANGVQIENAIGGSGGDAIIGNDTKNHIVGGGGNDTINAGGGDDIVIGGTGNDIVTGGTGNDIFRFAAGFGNDRINDFDANPSGGQDQLDISGLGITAVTFGSVTVTDLGSDTLVQIGSASILLVGVIGQGQNIVTQQDFLLA